MIHPGVRHEIFGIALYTAVSQRERVILPPDLVIKYEIAAENARLKSGQLTVSGPDVARALVPDEQTTEPQMKRLISSATDCPE